MVAPSLEFSAALVELPKVSLEFISNCDRKNSETRQYPDRESPQKPNISNFSYIGTGFLNQVPTLLTPTCRLPVSTLNHSFTHRPLSSSLFWGLPYRILHTNPQKGTT